MLFIFVDCFGLSSGDISGSDVCRELDRTLHERHTRTGCKHYSRPPRAGTLTAVSFISWPVFSEQMRASFCAVRVVCGLS